MKLYCQTYQTVREMQDKKLTDVKMWLKGLPWWHSGSACQCRGHGFKPWYGKIPHAVEQLSPCATTTEPTSHNH